MPQQLCWHAANGMVWKLLRFENSGSDFPSILDLLTDFSLIIFCSLLALMKCTEIDEF